MDDLDALLADLQNSVPGQTAAQQQAHFNAQHSSTGYGSLNTGRGKQSPHTVQSPNYQNTTQRIITTTEQTSRSPVYNNGSSPTNYQSLSRSNTPHNSLPRSVTPQYQQQQQQYSQQYVQQQQQQNAGGNLSELDSLLQDLSSARYGSNTEKKDYYSNVANGTTSPTSNVLNDSTNRPSVDSLLEELSSAHTVPPVYAVPNGVSNNENLTPGPPHGGRHVTITVRETTTEKISGSPVGDSTSPTTPIYGGHNNNNQSMINQQITSQTRHNVVNTSAPGYSGPAASSATKELDDLMASLSDFKVNAGSHQLQTVTDYAKPNKGTAHFQETVTSVTTTTEENRDQLDSMLGNLQSDMSRRGVNTTQKGCCTACEKPIVGQVITALGKTWHPEHFVCNHCNQELGTRNFFERDGNPYCEPDYHNLFSPRCAYCNGPILDKCVTALEKTWHTEHFFCAQCGQQFGDDGFHERDGKPYCKNDYFDQFAPKCNGCNRAIMENYISALNSQWHPECFVCRDCRKPVRGKSFYALEGKPVCPPCVGIEDED
jgi:paxillin